RAASVVPGSGEGPTVVAEGGVVGAFGLPGSQAVAVAATAAGPLAGGLEAEQVSRGVDGLHRGLANVRCETTATDSWFVGGSTRPGAETELILVNPYDDPALADVDVLTPSGPALAPSARGIGIPPRSRVVQPLAAFAPDVRALAVHVRVRAGRVSAAVRDSRARGRIPLGADWVPRVDGPSPDVVVAGIPPGNGERLLYLAVPGDDDTTVSVELTRTDGQYVPTGFDEIDVPAGQVRVVDLTKALDEAPATIRVRSDTVPVLAGAYVENRARFNPIREIAYVGATESLTGSALLTDTTVARNVNSYLLLSAPEADAVVTVDLVGVRGRPLTTTVHKAFRVPGGRLVVVPLSRVVPPGPLRPLVLTVPPDSPPVYAARLVDEQGERGPLFTVLGLRSQLLAGVPEPFAQADLHLPVEAEPPPATG
ncbi:MAG: DUF5719 family protein, partial [Frankia sp.]|nr:DUF5719 family protein [Frankia sp.]